MVALSFKQYKLMQNYYFTHIIIFRFIRIFKVPLLLSRQLNVNMGQDRGGLILLDGTVFDLDILLILMETMLPKAG